MKRMTKTITALLLVTGLVSPMASNSANANASQIKAPKITKVSQINNSVQKNSSIREQSQNININDYQNNTRLIHHPNSIKIPLNIPQPKNPNMHIAHRPIQIFRHHTDHHKHAMIQRKRIHRVRQHQNKVIHRIKTLRLQTKQLSKRIHTANHRKMSNRGKSRLIAKIAKQEEAICNKLLSYTK